MKKSILVIVAFLLIMQAFLVPFAAHADPNKFVIGDNKYIGAAPRTLKDAVDELKYMMLKEKKSRWEIAKRAATIADRRIINNNDSEAMTLPGYWLNPIQGSEEYKEWKKFSDKMGDEGQYDAVAKWVWENGYGQCAENAALVYYLLKEAGAKDLHIINVPEHRFVAWGLGDGNPNDEESWNNNVIVADSWQGEVLRGKAIWEDDYCANGGHTELKDQTFAYDNAADPPCGSIITDAPGGSTYQGTKISKCCKTGEPCHDPRSVCSKDRCVPCGKLNRPCCPPTKRYLNRPICEEGLKCINNVCIKWETGKAWEIDQFANKATFFSRSDVPQNPYGLRLYDIEISLYREGPVYPRCYCEYLEPEYEERSITWVGTTWADVARFDSIDEAEAIFNKAQIEFKKGYDQAISTAKEYSKGEPKLVIDDYHSFVFEDKYCDSCFNCYRHGLHRYYNYVFVIYATTLVQKSYSPDSKSKVDCIYNEILRDLKIMAEKKH